MQLNCSSLYRIKFLHVQLTCLVFVCLQCTTKFVLSTRAGQNAGFVQISDRNMTTFNNRNITIMCRANVANRTEHNLSFTANARMVLTFMTVPRQLKPLNQLQSFLHCIDPNRTDCLAEFNFDISCLEDRMNSSYYYNRKSYLVEAACQVDDSVLCSHKWMSSNPVDCYDLGHLTVFKAPKLGERCLQFDQNRTIETQCGDNQECDLRYGICLCVENYSASNKKCVRNEFESLPIITENIITNRTSDVIEGGQNNYDDQPPLVVANSRGTFKAIVIFLLIIAILLSIALGIVIIWSRNYRRLLEEFNSSH